MTQPTDVPDYVLLGQKLEIYCKKFSIPLEHFFEIINDQKVIPMLRGKGMEYNAVNIMRQTLSPNWEVVKLNLAAQPGTPDQDIGLIYRRTGTQLIVESKTAVRGSATAGDRARLYRGIPHFKVKCHRSRSNIKLATQGNDRYNVNDFDIVISNVLNALIAGATMGEELEMVPKETTVKAFYEHYRIEEGNQADLLLAAASDWRFAVTKDLADPKTKLLPRTPYVYLGNDPTWKPLPELEKVATAIVQEKYSQARQRLGHN